MGWRCIRPRWSTPRAIVKSSPVGCHLRWQIAMFSFGGVLAFERAASSHESQLLVRKGLTRTLRDRDALPAGFESAG